ncbi:MAG TPA: hypothetical protein VFE51_16450, partial [Verrucomicrobiae bacterium]|nr:hypothetical protein [Verrucomicrobiae bacterium]
PNARREEGPGTKEGRRAFSRSSEEKPTGRKYNFKPAPLLHFHSAADIDPWDTNKLRFLGRLSNIPIAFSLGRSEGSSQGPLDLANATLD